MLDSLDTLIAFVLVMLVVSLLITIVVQMFAAALNLRGVNLISGLGSVIAVIDPGLEGQKTDLAKYLLRGRLLSDSFLPIELSKGPKWLQKWLDLLRPTSAARPAELFDAIHRIAIAKEPSDADLKANARALLKALGLQVDSSPEIQAAARLRDTVRDALAKLPDESLRAEAQTALTQVSAKLDEFKTGAATAGVAIAGDIDSAYRKFNYWVRIADERAQQWLTMHTRILTIFWAAVFAFVLQLDTVEIFKLVSSNKAVREKLVAQASAVTAQAEKLFADKVSRESNSVLQKAYAAWLIKTAPAVQDALKKASINVDPNDTREKLTERIDTALAGIDGKEAALKSFNDLLDKISLDSLKQQAGDYAAVKADLDKTGFELFPKNGWRWGKHWYDGWGVHWLGVLFSIGLLSLGAPFWYHSLKDLVSLRSQVAQNISEQQEQAQKKQSRAPPRAPPTVKS